MLLESYAPVAIFLVIAIAFPFVPLAISRVIAPKKYLPHKAETYECGIEPTGDANVQFRIQFFLYALIFVVFDVEAVFLLPWAVTAKTLGPVALVEILVFVAFLAVGLVYAWRKGAFEWK
jgi:NADH:ubiquinone oxidoreductase subunit 3 (subunit A)